MTEVWSPALHTWDRVKMKSASKWYSLFPFSVFFQYYDPSFLLVELPFSLYSKEMLPYRFRSPNVNIFFLLKSHKFQICQSLFAFRFSFPMAVLVQIHSVANSNWRVVQSTLNFHLLCFDIPLFAGIWILQKIIPDIFWYIFLRIYFEKQWKQDWTCCSFLRCR